MANVCTRESKAHVNDIVCAMCVAWRARAYVSYHMKYEPRLRSGSTSFTRSGWFICVRAQARPTAHIAIHHVAASGCPEHRIQSASLSTHKSWLAACTWLLKWKLFAIQNSKYHAKYVPFICRQFISKATFFSAHFQFTVCLFEVFLRSFVLRDKDGLNSCCIFSLLR